MPNDGAQIGLDWEIPAEGLITKDIILKGSISTPIVLVIHDLNNDATFGYIRSLMRKCTTKGWIVVGFNQRGCGVVPLTTPRDYTAAYTSDLRAAIHILSSRMNESASFSWWNLLSGKICL